MTLLLIYDESGNLLEKSSDYQYISHKLNSLGILFERWETKNLNESATAEEVLQAYKEDIDRINRMYNFQSIDVVSLTPDHPKKDET